MDASKEGVEHVIRNSLAQNLTVAHGGLKDQIPRPRFISSIILICISAARHRMGLHIRVVMVVLVDSTVAL